jgi:hypothetical protein
MKLSIDEIMVGDWVYIIDHPIKKEAKQVKPEHFLRSLVIFEPIPLTKEILEKNGFELKDDCEYFGVGDRVMLRDNPEYMNTNNTWDVHIDTTDYRTIGNLELTYVHELQHFLKSCKINKKIIL